MKNCGTLIVEGVYINAEFMAKMVQKYGSDCYCFFINLPPDKKADENDYIDWKDKYIKRSQGRNEKKTVNNSYALNSSKML